MLKSSKVGHASIFNEKRRGKRDNFGRIDKSKSGSTEPITRDSRRLNDESKINHEAIGSVFSNVHIVMENICCLLWSIILLLIIFVLTINLRSYFQIHQIFVL